MRIVLEGSRRDGSLRRTAVVSRAEQSRSRINEAMGGKPPRRPFPGAIGWKLICVKATCRFR